MGKLVVLDSGPIISLVLNNLLQFLEPLKERMGGEFVITPAVRAELIDRPIQGKRFEFEALRVLRHIREGTLTFISSREAAEEAQKLLSIANQIFQVKGQWMRIIHYAEMEAIALAAIKNAEAVVVDERTTRMLIENPEGLEVRLSKKLHSKVNVNRHNLNEFKRRTRNVKVIRSVELMAVAYELGLLEKYMPENIPERKPEEVLLDAVLWGLKLNGCAISENEIHRIKQLLLPPKEQ
ncbi:hypothetical protein D6764_03095 [Candidatus Woesearchaeota archaeon]|nr:MAG: hypothetical protein D6764_03095 [Candidatus Woesearchaeota archaeon]